MIFPLKLPFNVDFPGFFLSDYRFRDSSGPNLIEPLVMLHRNMEVLSLLSCRVFGDPKTGKLNLPGCFFTISRCPPFLSPGGCCTSLALTGQNISWEMSQFHGVNEGFLKWWGTPIIRPWLGIEVHGDLGIPHFKKHPNDKKNRSDGQCVCFLTIRCQLTCISGSQW